MKKLIMVVLAVLLLATAGMAAPPTASGTIVQAATEKAVPGSAGEVAVQAVMADKIRTEYKMVAMPGTSGIAADSVYAAYMTTNVGADTEVVEYQGIAPPSMVVAGLGWAKTAVAHPFI